MATIIGSDGNDKLIGTAQDDLIEGLAGVDFFGGSTGNDIVDGGQDADKLQFEQSDFAAGVTRFTVTLDNYAISHGALQLVNGGAGTVAVDLDGDGVADVPPQITSFTEIDAVRVVSGVRSTTAGDGQGNDTLDVIQLSRDAGGISYDLTNRGSPTEAAGSPAPLLAGQSAGDVRFSANVHLDPLRSSELDFESLFIKMDGAEHVIGGPGNDLLFIDETEAAKDNTFSAGLGYDRVEYQNFYGVAELDAEPSVTIRVNSIGARSHEIEMTGGRIGTTVAVDTLIDVELITLLDTSNTAASSRNDDTIDVSAMTGRVVIDYSSGEIRDGNGAVQLTIENIQEFERVVDGGFNTNAANVFAVMTTGDIDTAMIQNHNTLDIVGIDPVDYSLTTFLFA